MRGIEHEERPHRVGDLTERPGVDGPRVGGRTGHDQRRLLGLGQVRHLVEVDHLARRRQVVRLGRHAVGDEAPPLRDDGRRRPVAQVATVVEPHGEDGRSRLEERLVRGQVRVRPGVGLDVGVLRSEERRGALARQVLHLVDDLVAPVVATAGIPLRVLVGQHRARGGQHRRRGEVLGRDQLQRRLLAVELLSDAGRRPRRRRPALSRSCSCDPFGAHVHRVYRWARRGPGRQPVRSPGHGPRPAHTGCRRRRPGHDARRRPAGAGGAARARRS